MDYRKLGGTGLLVSEVGLGCNNFGMRIDLEGTRKVVSKALDLGVTLFDTADNYGNMGGSETLLGDVLGSQRQNIVLATKFTSPMAPGITRKNASRAYVMTAVEASLRRLKTDWIDLYQMHYHDELTGKRNDRGLQSHRAHAESPIEETLRALDDLVKQGKIRYIGCSNMLAWHVVEAQWTSRHHNLHRFVTMQAEYSVLVREIEREILPVLESYNIGLLPYFPLASGLLTGKYSRTSPPPPDTRFSAWQRLGDRYATETNWDAVEHLRSFSAARGKSLLELAFNWLLAKPVVASVIAGATKPEQVEQNVAAASWKLTVEDLAEIDKMPRGFAPAL